jgi:exo-1,4-beta-D-glucosaminidase
MKSFKLKKKSSALVFLILGVTFLFCSPLSGQERTEYDTVLSRNWHIRSSLEVKDEGKEVSSPNYDLKGWYASDVPTTVLAALVKNGVYKDPYFGKNLEDISTEPFKQPWWYRKEFEAKIEKNSEDARLIFYGINYSADVFLNGHKIVSSGSLVGGFRIFEIDITDVIENGKNVLAVKVFPPTPGDFTVGFVDWNPRPPDENMGIWREVKLRVNGPVSINRPFVQSKVNLETLEEAALTCSAELVNHSNQPVQGLLKGEIEGVQFSQEYSLKPRQRKTILFHPEQHTELNLRKPRLWWPNNLGEQNLFKLTLSAFVNDAKSDEQHVSFGIREVSDYVNEEGHRGFMVNGKKVLIRGGGWVDNLMLADDSRKIEAQIKYAKHMNLNTIRLEGFWGSSETLYDLADQYGILLMVGWSCHWEWEEYLGKYCNNEFGGVQTPEEMELVAKSFRDQVTWLRNHPSIFVWALASDKLPRPELETKYRECLKAIDPGRPILSSTAYQESEISGPSRVKMNGPYDYVTPNYWYVDKEHGGAFGFNSETGPGPQPPPIESLKKMIPEDHLWPIDDYWNYHCGRFEFNTLDRYKKALENRYGLPGSLAEFVEKAQVASYEAMRAMFEAFGAHKPKATGIIQWMFNSAWPEMYWQLFDYYLMPNGAFYGAKRACTPLHILYHYGDRAIYVSNDTHVPAKGLKAEVRILNIHAKELLKEKKNINIEAYSSLRITQLPDIDAPEKVYFVDLRLKDKKGKMISNNFYWLSTKEDVLDEEGTEWFFTPNKEYADFTGLEELPEAKIPIKFSFKRKGDDGEIRVRMNNRSKHIAFFIHFNVTRSKSGNSVLPIFWDDNYISLLPGEKREINAHFALDDLNGETPLLEVSGWNVPMKRFKK